LVLSKVELSLIVGKYVGLDEDGENIFDFERIVPIGDAPGMRVDRWGSNRHGYWLDIGSSCMDFYTAWSPPIPIIKKLAELHKDIVFRLEYYEPGMAFRGVSTAKWQGSEVLLDDNSWIMSDEDFDEIEKNIAGNKS
jgi:hypothetical protein